ncbi:BA14K family protein [Mesorhizobium sp. CAU 1741]|uniref:BA14K family protein n=1 Tax=Mesorhizobium sp. CAU 1741 TaxID=3140366 RepID=UPI00325B08BA
MKALLATVSGFAVAMVLFGGGVAVATGVIMVDDAPQARAANDVAQVWTGKPRPVDVDAQAFERVGPPVVTMAEEVDGAPADDGSSNEALMASADPGVDTMTTAAYQPAEEAQMAVDEALIELHTAHVEWCSSHYRSYDPDSDSYRPYSGGFRACESPYSEEMAAWDAPEYATPVDSAYSQVEDASVQTASFGGQQGDSRFGMTPEHVRSCFDRYRSYRVEDNSYQPYGGGPRQQCE